MAGKGYRGRGRGQNNSISTPVGAVNKEKPQQSNPVHGNREGKKGGPSGRVDPFHRPLDFIGLQKLSDDSTQPADVVRRFNTSDIGLRALLQTHRSDYDVLELIFVVLGSFCNKNGPTQFTDGFVEIVRTLGEGEIFQQIPGVVMHLPNSRAVMSITKVERLKRLINGVYHLSIETLVLVPSFACTFLGKNFYQDLLVLKELPSIKGLKCQEPIFDILLEGIPRLEDAWTQHSAVEQKQDEEEAQYEERVRRQVRDELIKLQKPPDDFRKMTVMPNWEDLHLEGQPFLRPNVVEGQYPDAETYLDVQFRLMREDFVQPLRAGIQEFKKQADRKQQRFRVDNVKFYYDVTIAEQDLNQDQFTLQFSMQGLKGVNWEGSKRLMTGSLLCLTKDRFKTIAFFTVAARDPRKLKDGKIIAHYEGGPLPDRRSRDTFLMAESSVYFEAYRSVLQALQRISPVHLPLADYLLGKFSKSAEPDYLVGRQPIYDFTSVPMALSYTKTTAEVEDNPTNEAEEVQSPPTKTNDEVPTERVIFRKNPRLGNVHLRSVEDFPSTEELNLDVSQRAALLTALTRKVAVVQGPPGTGKTYLGLKIVQVLLDNRRYWNGPVEEQPQVAVRPRFAPIRPRRVEHVPILVICYTNHALDQFLEGIMAFTKKIVRIGGQSKCQALEPFMLREWSKRSGGSEVRDCRRWVFDVRSRMDHINEELTTVHELYKTVETFGIVHEDSLLNLNIFNRPFHNKLIQWRRKISRDPAIHQFPALALWLGIYPSGYTNPELEKVGKIHSRRTVYNPRAAKADEPEREDADDLWDREDIEEIQGQRVVVGDVEVPVNRPNEKKDQPIPERFGIHFGVKTSQLIKDKKGMEDYVPADPSEMEYIQHKMNQLQNQAAIISQLLESVPPLNETQLRAIYNGDINAVPFAMRWAAYNAWKRGLLNRLAENERTLEQEFRKKQNELAEVRTKEKAEICRPADIVGFTTSGAAKQRALIDHLKPSIVIVEEAAQVLEAHVVTALSASCQHLILIGDHQQLKPPTTVYHLAKDYHLDISLFERLIRNGMEPSVLGVQHRMRPEVARLIVPSIYPKLDNHESVLSYPEVRGLAKSVFFLAHNELEKSDYDGRSHSNPYEAELALALARHLIFQGYSAHQITILTTYSGQLLHFRKLRNQANRNYCRGLRIAVVDNFQGEENEVIILSLVRSNEAENIGFLRIENRICVALSRAKQGFYLIGNMDVLQGRSKLWNQISKVLESNGEIGTHFPLKCIVHGDEINANKPEDFPPEGGCMKKCQTEMACGHICPQLCHASDREHVAFKCREQCKRSCPAGHPCPKICFADCHPCRTKVVKMLPCTHEQEVQCHEDPAKVFCITKVLKDSPFCDHRIEMRCGDDPSKAICPEVCGMERECGHICPLQCHKQSSHKELPCDQPCRIACPEGHPCPRKCCEPCRNCLVSVEKKLPCDHVQVLPCFKAVEEVFCPVPVEKILPCQHTMELECSTSVTSITCKQVCDKIICNDEHRCKLLCFKPCRPCFLRVDRQLNCGHSMNVVCSKPVEDIVCNVPKKSTFPDCGHKGNILCGVKIEDAKCTHPCDRRLNCGHTCTQRCHVKKDPDHELYKCMKQCESINKNCHRDHRCGKKCFEECDPCSIRWKRKLTCGHSLVVSCHLSDEEAQALCRESVRKEIPDCGHFINVRCGYRPTRADCKERCKSLLDCGHKCAKKCSEPCNSADCEVLVRLDSANFCGHPITLPCQDTAKVDVNSDQMKEQLLYDCNEKCNVILDCEHPCAGTCGECFNGRFHVPCQEKCGRVLICEHSCKVNCATSCPPCNQPCEYKCQHSKCPKKCSQPCAPCQEPCGWRCDHYRCTRRCSEPCNRPKCDAPCSKTIEKCGHPCVGLCGELCPPLCRVCDFDELTAQMILMDPEDPDAKFVYLADCGHTVEVSDLDYWMSQESGKIQRKCCPRCKTTITWNMRYGDVLTKIFADIVLVKNKIFDTREHPQEFGRLIAAEIAATSSCLSSWSAACQHPVKQAIRNILAEFERLISPPKKGKGRHFNLDGDQRHRIRAAVDLIGRMCKLIKNIVSAVKDQKGSSSGLKAAPVVRLKEQQIKELLDQLQMLLASFYRRQRVSNQEYHECVEELERLDLIRAYYLLMCSPYYTPGCSASPKLAAVKKNLIENVTKLDDQRKTQTLKILEEVGELLKNPLGITVEEKEQIVKAMGMSRGHWFKCPNGHVYAIGNCGGAVMESTCNECGARIGGEGHRLRQDNGLASEMDGATAGAWPGPLH